MRMRYRGILVSGVALSTCLAISCRSVETSGTGGASTSTGQGGHGSTASSHAVTSSGAGGAPLATITFTAQAVRTPQGTPVSGANICIIDHADIPCVMTDTQGAFDIAMPAKAETGLTLAKAGFAGVLVPIVTSDQDISGYVIGLPASSEVAGYYQAGGETFPQVGKGFLAVYTSSGNTQNGKDGVAATLTPSSPPLYANTSGTPDATLLATSTRGFVKFGDLTPGVVEVVLTANALCDTNFGGWPSKQAHGARMPIVEGFETHVGFGCF